MTCRGCGKEVVTNLCVDCFVIEVKAADPLSDETIREWSKKMLLGYVQYFIGEKGWEKLGASHPDQLIDIIFSQIQVALLGYAEDIPEADVKREAIDRMLRIRK